MKHTALPWQLHPVYPGLKIVANYQETEGSATYSEICNVNPNTDLENGNTRDNADLILNACNCHEELVEACNYALEQIQRTFDITDQIHMPPRWLDADIGLNNARGSLQEALANATK